MKNPVGIAKKSYNKILKIDDLLWRLEQIDKQQQDLSNKIANINDLLTQQDIKYNQLKDIILTESKINELRFNALFKRPNETQECADTRFFKNMASSNKALKTFQAGNVKLLKVFIELCKKNNLTYFLQSGTLLGAIRHGGFVPWDDDTDVAMFRDDIIELRKILKGNKKYKLALGYDHYNKSRQLRFRTTNPDNPCFIDVYIYDYGTDASDGAWKKWHELKQEIDNKFENDNPQLAAEWREAFLAEEDSSLGRQLKPLFEKYYDSLLDSKINKKNYTTINWGLDNFPVKWKRLFEKDMIFPTIPVVFEGLKVEAPNQYSKYLERQYGDIYKLPKDLVTHFHHIDQNNINIDVINEFLK